jgi:hypothetical protein
VASRAETQSPNRLGDSSPRMWARRHRSQASVSLASKTKRSGRNARTNYLELAAVWPAALCLGLHVENGSWLLSAWAIDEVCRIEAMAAWHACGLSPTQGRRYCRGDKRAQRSVEALVAEI